MSRRHRSDASTPRGPGGRDGARPPRRRGPTRWLLVTPLVALVVIIAGVVGLEALAPTSDVTDRRLEGVPPLAMEDDPSCERRADGDSEDVREDVVEAVVPHGRISAGQVAGCPSAFDGLEVTYVGEVVGELLPRTGGAWAQVNDDPYALEVGPLVDHRTRAGANSGLSVWLPDGLHEEVEAVGRAGVRGDVILVRGTVHRADPDDGGGLTIRAEQLELIADAMRIEEPLHVPQAIVAGLLALVAVGAAVWARVMRRR